MYQMNRGKLIGFILCAGLMMLPALAWGNAYVLNLDGAGDYVAAADNDNLSAFTDGSFTVQAWIFVQAFSSNMPIASKYLETGDQRSWAFMVTSTGQLRAYISLDGTFANTTMWQTTVAAVTTDNWHHVAMVVDPAGADKLKFYVDNVEYGHSNSSIDPPAVPYNSNAELWIGRFNLQYFYGYIDEFRLYDGVISSFPDDVLDLPFTADSNTEVLYSFNYPAGDVFDHATVGGNPTNTGFLQGDATRRAWNSLGPGNDIPLPVTLVSMSAIGADELVKISWSTESEYDNLGFHLYRSTNQDAGFERINNDLIPSQGYTPTTQYYNYVDDRGLINGVTYYYQISDVDVNGRERTHQLIASATPMADIFLPGENTSLAGYQLSQNYPNPFNASTTIRYYVRDGGMVRLSVYDLNGKEVSVLVNEHQDVGEYFHEFNATSLPTGIYFVRLIGQDGYDNIKKMLFLK